MNPRRKLIQPVRPLKKDERAYFRLIDSLIVDLQTKTERGLHYANDSLASWLVSIRDTFFENKAFEDDWSFDRVEAHFKALKAYHDGNFLKNASRTFGVDIRPLLHDYTINLALNNRIKTNVGLIQSIPIELHPQLITQVTRVYQNEGFNRAALQEVVLQRFAVASSRAKLIARDQTSKTIGQFNQIRQQQIGVGKYQWLGAGDERERETHAINNNQIFAWDDPPPLTGHPGEDINCRCVAVGIVEF